ncbi:MAG: hypothetical protein ACXVCO_04690, partial [Ktedonobacterales bacterium]
EYGLVGSVNGATAPTAQSAVGVGAATAVASPLLQTEATQPLGDVATVVVAAGDGWVKVFESLGATHIVPGGQTMNPSTQELLHAVEACPAEKVIVLPNNSNVVLSARQVPQLTSKQVHVIATDSMPQGVGALLAFNFEADFEVNYQAMESAYQRVQTAEITRAVRSVQIDGINVTEGDVIGLVNGHLVTAGTDLEAVVQETLTRMCTEQYEIVTLYYGADIAADTASMMAQRIKERFPAQEVEVVQGGQPFYAYIISAE